MGEDAFFALIARAILQFFQDFSSNFLKIVYLCPRQMKLTMNGEMIHKLRSCLATLPVEKAWLFGSYSRGEERPDSDIDLLVRFDEEAKISLFKYASIILTLEAAMGKDVDLVQEGSLLPFAAKTADEDKILIYERAN